MSCRPGLQYPNPNELTGCTVIRVRQEGAYRPNKALLKFKLGGLGADRTSPNATFTPPVCYSTRSGFRDMLLP